MNFPALVVSVFSVLTILAFWLSYRKGAMLLAYKTAAGVFLLSVVTLCMERGFLQIFVLLLVFGFLLIFVGYWTLVNLGSKKPGTIIGIIIAIIVGLPILGFVFEDFLFFRRNARSMLREDGIELKDEFKILGHHITGMNDLYETFELEISVADKQRLIRQLSSSRFFWSGKMPEMYDLQHEMGLGLTRKVCIDYEQNGVIYRETFQRLREGYKPDLDIISVSSKGNTLNFQRINE